MSKCVLLFGGNLGNVQANFIQAEAKIAKTIGTVTQKSEIYESEAWGFESSDLFLNQVIVIQTKLNPIDILKRTQDIEFEIGRKEKTKNNEYTSRLIDIDILFFDSEIIKTETLTIPHPRLHLRNFTLQPLAEIMPLFMHPTLNKSISDLLKESPDTSICNKKKN